MRRLFIRLKMPKIFHHFKTLISFLRILEILNFPCFILVAAAFYDAMFTADSLNSIDGKDELVKKPAVTASPGIRGKQKKKRPPDLIKTYRFDLPLMETEDGQGYSEFNWLDLVIPTLTLIFFNLVYQSFFLILLRLPKMKVSRWKSVEKK